MANVSEEYFTAWGTFVDALTAGGCEETGYYTFANLAMISPALSKGPIWLAMTIFTVFCIVIGILGNIASVITLIRDDMKRAGNLFLVSMSMSDLIVVTVSIPVMFVNFAFDRFTYPTWICDYMGYLSGTYTTVSVFSITAVAIDRFYAICKPNIYSVYFTRRNIVASIIFMWVLGPCSMFCINNTKGMVHFGLTPARACCINFLSRFAVFQIFTELTGPFLLVSYLYYRMFSVIFKSREAMRQHQQANANVDAAIKAAKKREDKREREIYLMMLAVFVTFLLCWFPYTILISLRCLSLYCPNHDVAGIAEAFAIYNSAFNPIMYGVFNTNFRQSYYKMANTMTCGLVKWLFGTDQVVPAEVGDQKSVTKSSVVAVTPADSNGKTG